MQRILSSKRFQRIVAGIILPVFLFVGVLGQPMSALAQTVHNAQLAQVTAASAVRTGSVIQLAQAGGGKAALYAAAGTALGTFLGSLGADAAGLLIFYWIFNSIVEIFSKIVNELLVWSLRTFILLTGYNDFLNNEFVNSGWATLRDIGNLFFVVILLVIAFATVLNISSYEYQQLLPKFVLAIFLVNFSRTIVGLMIDASQVVMVTFASAFYQSAAGNFVRLLRIDQWLQVKPLISAAVSSAGSAVGGSTLKAIGDAIVGVSPIENFVALLFTLAVATFALGVGLTLVAVIVYRIVALWLLIIFSPLAFLAWVLPSTRSYFSQWMGVLVKQLTVGPLLVFVVWLALSTVQQNPQSYALLENSQSITQIMSSLGMTSAYGTEEQGSILNAQLGQSVGDNQIASTAISSWNNLTAFVVAITVLIAGIKFASGMSGGAGAFAEKLAGYARKPVDFAEKKARVFGKWAAKKGITEPINESAWYLRNKKEAKRAPVVGRFFKSSEERIKDSERYNMDWYANNKGIRDLGKGRGAINQGEAAEKERLKEKYFQDSQEIIDDTQARFGNQGPVINADGGNAMGLGDRLNPKNWGNPAGSLQKVRDYTEMRARRDMYKDLKAKELERTVVAGANGVTRDNLGATRQQALQDALDAFDDKFNVREHNPPTALDPGDANQTVPATRISGHLVSGSPTQNPAGGGGSNRPAIPPSGQNPANGGGTNAPSGGASPYAASSAAAPVGSPLAANGGRQPAGGTPPTSSGNPSAPDSGVDVTQNNQSSTTVNVNATVNASQPANAAAGAAPSGFKRPVGTKQAPSAPAGASLADAKAASEAKDRAAQDAKAATRAAGARARKEDAKSGAGANAGVPPISDAGPTLRRDSGAVGQKAAEAAREQSPSNAQGGDIVIEAAQNAQLSREVEDRLREIETTQAAAGSVAETRKKQIDALAAQLTDMAAGKPKAVRQVIMQNPDVRKIVAGIVKDPIAARQLQMKIEKKMKENPDFKGVGEAEIRRMSEDQTKVAMRALKKEEPERLDRQSRGADPDQRRIAREVMDEPEDESVSASSPVASSEPASEPPEISTSA